MKLLHLSDLHLGKRVHECSMLPEQAYILERILEAVEAERPDAVLIAGDIYDKPVPSAEAVELLDGFLCRLSAMGLTVFLISGNHDSPERLAFASRLIERSGIHLSPVYHGEVEPVTLRDEYGEVRFYMLPFIKPVHVRRCFPDEEIESYTDAIRCAVRHMEIDPAKRNVLITHQFVTGARRCESEEISVGGVDSVSAEAFESFDYVALGHLHSPQSVQRETLRYCGTPLKYSFSEARDTKSVTIAELSQKGSLSVRTIPLTPLHDMRELRGSYEELTLRKNYAGTATDDFLHITLTDEEDVPDAIGRLRSIYKNLLRLDYDNARTRAAAAPLEMVASRSPMELFAELYENQNGKPMTRELESVVSDAIERIWGGAK